MKGSSSLSKHGLDVTAESESDLCERTPHEEKTRWRGFSLERRASRLTIVYAGAFSPIPSWKRALDLIFILLTLPFWLPLMALAALMIKAVSGGPIFFRQQRIGFGGNNFMILKFRSMKVNAETQAHESHLDRLIRSNSPMTKLDSSGDSRLIFGGRLFRATGLDELPQIFNVIRGEMSLVGPRPCTLHEFDRYEPWQRNGRVKVPPGLTGYWQVNGKNKTTFSQMIEMDLNYADRFTLWLDLVIIFKTIPAICEQIIACRRVRISENSGDSRQDAPTSEPINESAN